MTPSRSPMRGSIATVVLLACAVPLSAQTSPGAFALTGMTNAALWAPAGAAVPGAPALASSEATSSPAVTAPFAAPGKGAFLPNARVGVAASASRSTVPAPQAQDGGGGFPWLEVGIGAAVGALFIQAVATANSGDAAELPRGGISVVLPSS